MFLLNSCLGQFSAATCVALLLPKLRSHFAEFLNNASPAGLRILSSSTCVGLRYGYCSYNSGFSWQPGADASQPDVAPRSSWILASGFANLPSLAFLPVFSLPAHLPFLRPHSSGLQQCWNINQLSIGYAFRPRLRSRLPQSRSALLWKPQIFGLEDSHLHLATHSGILSSMNSTSPFGNASALIQCSSTDTYVSHSFGVVF